MIKKKVVEGVTEYDGNTLKIAGEKIPLIKVDKLPGSTSVRAPIRSSRRTEQPTTDIYMANHAGVNWYLTGGATVTISRVNARGSGLEKTDLTMIVKNGRIEVEHFWTDRDRIYEDVFLKTGDFYHEDSITLSDSMITSKSFRMDGTGELAKLSINVEGNAEFHSAHLRGVEFTDFERIKIKNASVGNWSGRTVFAVNCDGDPGSYSIEIAGVQINAKNLADLYPSIPGVIEIKHRAHYGFFAGITPVAFVRMKDDSVLLNGFVKLTLSSVTEMMSAVTFGDFETKPPEMKRVWDMYVGNYSPNNKNIPANMTIPFKDFLFSIKSRLELFATLSVLNK